MLLKHNNENNKLLFAVDNQVILSESNIRVANVVDYVCWHNLQRKKSN